MKNFSKGITMFSLIISMLFCNASFAYASSIPSMEPISSEGGNILDFDIAYKEDAVIQSTNDALVTAVVYACEYADVYPTLGNYVGLYKTFVANAISECTQGTILVELYNPDGKLVSYDWLVGYNEAYSWNVFLPKAGTWRCRLIGAGTDATTIVTVGWR